MGHVSYSRVAILCSGNRDASGNATAENSRFSDLFEAFAARQSCVETVIYHDDFCKDIKEQLMGVDGVLVCRCSEIAISSSVRVEITAKTPMFFVKSTQQRCALS